jgi:hypothetical protein
MGIWRYALGGSQELPGGHPCRDSQFYFAPFGSALMYSSGAQSVVLPPRLPKISRSSEQKAKRPEPAWTDTRNFPPLLER